MKDSLREIGSMEKELREAEARKSKLMDLFIDGDISKTDYHEKNDNLTTRITDLKLELSERRSIHLELDTVLDECLNFLLNISFTWTNADSRIKRRIQDAIFPDGLVYIGNGEFRTPINSNAFNVLELLEMDESQVVPPPGFEPRLPAPEADALSS